MENFLKIISDSLSNMVANLSIDTLFIIMICVIAGAFLICGLWDAFSTVASNGRKIKKLNKKIESMDIDKQEHETELVEAISTIKGMKQPFMRFIAEPEEAPSKYFHFDEVKASKARKYSRLIVSLASALTIVVSLVFGAVYINLSAINPATLCIMIAGEVALFAILYTVMRVIDNVRMSKLHANYYALLSGLDKATESKVENYYMSDDDDEEDEEDESGNAKPNSNGMPNNVTQQASQSPKVHAYDVFEDYKSSAMGQSIGPMQVRKSSLERPTELKYQNPYLKDEQSRQSQGIVGKPVQAEKSYVITNSIENAAKEFMLKNQDSQNIQNGANANNVLNNTNNPQPQSQTEEYVHVGNTYRYKKPGLAKEGGLFEDDEEVAKIDTAQVEMFTSHAKKVVENKPENTAVNTTFEQSDEENKIIDGQISMRKDIFVKESEGEGVKVETPSETVLFEKVIDGIDIQTQNKTSNVGEAKTTPNKDGVSGQEIENEKIVNIKTQDTSFKVDAQTKNVIDDGKVSDDDRLTLQNFDDVIDKALHDNDEHVFVDVEDDKLKVKQNVEKQKKELDEFLKKSKGKTTIKPMDIVAKAKLAKEISSGDEDSQRTMQQIALLLHKEHEKNTSKSSDEQKRMNEALADLLRAMGTKK